jgi:hypothetical protein
MPAMMTAKAKTAAKPIFRRRFEGSVRDLLAFIGDAHFVAELSLGAADAQLCPHASEEFWGVPGAGDSIIREEVECGSALFSAWADKEDDAQALCGRCAANGCQ